MVRSVRARLVWVLGASLTVVSGRAMAEPAAQKGAEVEPAAPSSPVQALGEPVASGERQVAPDQSAPRTPAQPDAQAAPSSAEIEQARKHFETALEHYSRGQYRAAVDELERARALDPTGKDLVYNLALVHEKLGQFEQSLGYYRQYLEMESDADERARTEATLARLEGALREQRSRTVSERISAPDRPGSSESRSPGYADQWVWAAGGVAALALLTGAVLGIRALALEPGQSDATGGGRSIDDYREDAHSAHRAAVAADISFAVGLACASTATVLYFGRTPPLQEQTALRTPAVRGAGALVQLGARF